MSTEANELRSDIPKELSGRFVVGAKLVERAACIILRGVDRELGDRAVALKLFVDKPHDRKEWIDAFEREVSVLRSASHPSLVPIIAGGHDQGWLYIAMELVEAQSLRDYLKSKSGPMDVETAVNAILQICPGLREIHEKNGYHGHIDSRAVFLKGEELRLAGYYPHVLNEIEKQTTATGRLTVDPAYVSPDQISGEGSIDGRADIYSISVLLYEMLTGQRPYVAENAMQLAMMRLQKDPEPPRKLNPAVPAMVDAAVMRGLARDRNHRFATVDEFADALTGGKKPVKNPLLGAEGERLTGTETIAVSMSTESIKHILAAHEQKKTEKAAQPQGVAGTATGMKAGGGLDGAATMMGMKVDESLKASFVLLSGSDRGKKFFVDKPQVMIGSDSGCDIAVREKGVPPRYAIVVNRNGEFFAGPLSGTPVTINGQNAGSDEVKLKRGDVINAGSQQLRFVAPGEVFTLKDAVADRVIDRPPNKLPKILATCAIVGVLLSGGLIYTYRQNIAAADRQKRAEAENRKKKQKELIDQLRLQGDDFFRNGALIEPVEANARKRFEQILEVDPEDSYAKRRLAEIDERVKALAEQEARRRQFSDKIAKLLEDGDAYFKKGNYISPPGANARETYQEVLRLDPQSEIAQKQLGEINRILSDLVGQVNGMLNQAKQYIDQNQYVSPKGDNAKEVIDRVLSVDANNAEAKSLIIEMAARSLMDGDQARADLKPDVMKRSYLTAQALGVDPAFIEKKLQGIETIKRSKGSVVIIDTSKQAEEKRTDGKYLNMAEIERRINLLQVQGYGQKGAEKKLYEIDKGKIK